ncbi:MAG: hypothetical protein ACTSRC_14720 [Candidatus Helarchaeota archaeon]
MANISLVEGPNIPFQMVNTNNTNLLLRFFEKYGYRPLRRDSDLKYFTKIYAFDKYAICDILIYSVVDTINSAEELIPQIDGELQHLRRAILLGKPLFRNLSIQKHHFMTLHKQYARYSYQTRSASKLPVGFLIRPIILLQEEQRLDYLMGRTSRIDVISIDSHSLKYYMQRHREYLESKSVQFNLKKYRYWRISRWMIDYGHIPILSVWIFKLICDIIQFGFPFKLVSMIPITIFWYSSYISAIFIFYSTFKKLQMRELQDTAVASPTIVRDVPHAAASLGIVEHNNPISLPSPPAAESSSSEGQSKAIKARIKEYASLLLTLHNSKMLLSQGQRLLALVFHWIAEQEQLAGSATLSLMDLFKLVKQHPIISKFNAKLRTWVAKIYMQTPFTQTELKLFKKFIVCFLYELQLLPDDIQAAVKEKILTRTQVAENASTSTLPQLISQPLSSDPQDLLTHQVSEPSVPNTQQNRVASLDQPISLEQKEQSLSTKLELVDVNEREILELPKQEANLDRDSLHKEPLQSRTPMITSPYIRLMQKHEGNGVYCMLYYNPSDPQSAHHVEQYDAFMEGMDIRANHIDPEILRSDPNLKLQFEGHDPPAVMIGLGLNHTIIPFGRIGDDTRLHSLIKEYRQKYYAVIEKNSPDQITEKTVKEGPNSAIGNIENSVVQIADETVEEGPNRAIENTENSAVQGNFMPESLTGSSTSDSIVKPPVDNAELEMEKGTLGVDEQSLFLEEIRRELDEKLNLRYHLKYFPPASVMIDGMNVAYLYKDAHLTDGPSVKCILKVIKLVTDFGIPRDRIAIYFDANFIHLLKKLNAKHELKKYKELVKQGVFYEVPSETQADTAFIQAGHRLKRFIVITKDAFNDKPEWFRRHRVAVGLHADHVPYLAVDSIKDLILKFYGKKLPKQNNRRKK